MKFTIATILVGAGLVSAQSISSGCKTSLTNILASPDASCLNPSALISLATAGNDTSVVDPINNWLNGLCAQPACSNATLSAVVTNITTGCSTELSAAGLSTSDPSSIISVVQEAYPTVRQVVCLKDTSANALCITELLTDIQNSVGTLSISNIITIIPNIVSGSSTIPKNVTCNDCTKQAYNVVNKNFPGLISSSDATGLSTACGASFTDGASPSEISEIASTSTGTGSSKGGAASLFPINSLMAIAVSGLVVVSSAFFVLV